MRGAKTILVDQFIAGVLGVVAIFGLSLLVGMWLGESAYGWTMITLSSFFIWYLIRGYIKYYYLSKYGKDGWTPKRKKLMRLAILLGPLNILLFLWLLAKKDCPSFEKDADSHFGFSWK